MMNIIDCCGFVGNRRKSRPIFLKHSSTKENQFDPVPAD